MKLDFDGDAVAGLHRMILRELDDMLRVAAEDDDRIHRIHLSCKRIRTYLRLLREVLGDRRYGAENRFFRDFAHPFSALRDVEVAGDTLDKLLAAEPDAFHGAVTRLREQAGHAQPVSEAGTGLADVAVAVTLAQTRFVATAQGQLHLENAIRKLYRRNRNRFIEAKNQPDAERLHEWRKQAKYLRYALAAIEDAGPDQKAWRKRLKKLTTLLGDDHDLSVLIERLPAADRDLGALDEAVSRRHGVLQAAAFALGEQLYEKKPRAFVGGLKPAA